MTSPLATHHWEQDFSIPLIEIMLTVDKTSRVECGLDIYIIRRAIGVVLATCPG